jgi:hypothetical protein
MKPSLYIETTIPSYLTAWQSPQIIMAASQQITREWWNNHRHNYNLFISQIVFDESAGGDATAAAKRLEFLEESAILEPPDNIEQIVDVLMQQVPLPDNAATDALHIAICVANGINYLLNVELSSYRQRHTAFTHGIRV